jgi:hypothetical protein
MGHLQHTHTHILCRGTHDDFLRLPCPLTWREGRTAEDSNSRGVVLQNGHVPACSRPFQGAKHVLARMEGLRVGAASPVRHLAELVLRGSSSAGPALQFQAPWIQCAHTNTCVPVFQGVQNLHTNFNGSNGLSVRGMQPAGIHTWHTTGTSVVALGETSATSVIHACVSKRHITQVGGNCEMGNRT